MTPKIINIVRADAAGDYRLRLLFDDGHDQEVDFYPFLSQAAHPEIRVWLNPARFEEYRIEFGELVWGDHELCFPTIDLYRNSIDYRTHLEKAA